MTNPLKNRRPRLAARVESATPQTQRTLVVAILEYIYQLVPIHNAAEVLAAVRAGQFGDSPLRQELWTSHRNAELRTYDLAEDIDAIIDTASEPPADLLRKHRAEHQVHAAYLAGYHALGPDPGIAAAQVIDKGGYAAAGFDNIVPVVNAYLIQ